MDPNQLFDTEQEAQAFKDAHQLFVRVPEYLAHRKKWALVFPLEGHLTVRPHVDEDPRAGTQHERLAAGTTQHGAERHIDGDYRREHRFTDEFLMVYPAFKGELSPSDLATGQQWFRVWQAAQHSLRQAGCMCGCTTKDCTPIGRG